MEIACFYLPDFSLQVEWERLPVLRNKEVIVVFSPAPAKQEVLDFTPGMRGVQVGMPLQEALSHSKGAVLVEADMPRYFEAFERVLKALERCGPSVEAAELGCAYMDLTGLEKLYGGREGLKRALLESIPPPFIARVGIAPGKFPARAILEVRGEKWEVRKDHVAARCACPGRGEPENPLAGSAARPPGSSTVDLPPPIAARRAVPDPVCSSTLGMPGQTVLPLTSHFSLPERRSLDDDLVKKVQQTTVKQPDSRQAIRAILNSQQSSSRTVEQPVAARCACPGRDEPENPLAGSAARPPGSSTLHVTESVAACATMPLVHRQGRLCHP